MKWFRMYDEALDDPKVQKLDPELFRAWVNMLCLACKRGGVLPQVEDIAFALRADVTVAERWLNALVNGGLIDRVNGGANGYHYEPHSWGKRQYKTDTSNERVKRFRDRKRDVTVTLQETPPDTDTDTESDSKDSPLNPPPLTEPLTASPDGAAGKEDQHGRKRGSRLPVDWLPDTEDLAFAYQLGLDGMEVGAEFRDYWIAKPGSGGVKLDWRATWRNWCRSAAKRRGGVSGGKALGGGRKDRSRVEIYADVARDLDLRQQQRSDGIPPLGWEH